MSVLPFMIARPVYTLINIFEFPVVDVPFEEEEEEDVVALINILIPVSILLDSFVDDTLRGGRSLGEEQNGVYRSVAGRFSAKLGVDGKACLLRFVCELQNRPIAKWTVAGRLLTLLFTPHEGKSKDAELLHEYVAARSLGNMDEALCSSHYYSCPFSIFKYFEKLANITSSLYTDQ